MKKILLFMTAFAAATNAYAGSSLTKSPTYQASWKDPHTSQPISYTLSTLKIPLPIDSQMSTCTQIQTHKGILTIGHTTFDLALFCLYQEGQCLYNKIAIKHQDQWHYAKNLPDLPQRTSVRHALARIFADLFKIISLEA